MKELLQMIVTAVFAVIGINYVESLAPHEFQTAALLIIPVVVVACLIAINYIIAFFKAGFIAADIKITEKRHGKQIVR